MPQAFEKYLFERLPAVFRAEGEEGFTFRFLGLFAEVLQALEDGIYGVHRNLNPGTAPEEFLPWLASWVALDLDETWPEEKRRTLIKRVVDLYKWRGTIQGIKTFVEIYTGIAPEIIEAYTLGWCIGVSSTVGTDTLVHSPQEDAHCFIVDVRSAGELTAEQKSKVKAIVEIQKPAHTKVIRWDWVAHYWRVGDTATVGVDMVVGG
jgi:phage tail-like protein